MLLVAMPGTDPYRDFVAFAQSKGMGKKYETIALGQGQGERAELLIKQGVSKGFWILLENCHLGLSWLPTLQVIIQSLEDTYSRDFRLWLTTAPSSQLPPFIVNHCAKLIV